MLIDWFTVVAQALNFLVLVWLLKRFLYKPILNAIDEREEKVKSQIREAETRREEAEREKEKFRKKNEELDEKRESLMDEAAEKADEKRKQLLEEAREEARELRERLEKAVREEKESLQKEVAERTRQEVFAITRKVLKDLASQSMEEHMARAFIRRLKKLKGEKREQLAEALGETPEKALVRSAFELPAEQREKIEEAVAEILPADVQCKFEAAPEKISGVELTIGGYKVAWSIDDYLRGLEKKLDELLGQEEERQAELTSKTASDGSTE